MDWFDPKKPDPNWFPDPLYLYETFRGNPRAFRYFSGVTPNPLLDADTQTHYRYDPDGKNLMPLIQGEVNSLHDYLFWADDRQIAHGVVRNGEWKLHLMPFESTTKNGRTQEIVSFRMKTHVWE